MSNELSTQSNTELTGDAFTNPAYYEHVKSLAGLLANAGFTPKHLVVKDDKPRTLANCTRVVIQALRWGFDIFAVADESYEVHGRFGYQGKLIIAVVNARAGLKGRLRFDYEGQGMERTVTVSGRFADDEQPQAIALSVKQAKTQNEMWTKDPDQKLAYSGAIKWARRYCPELVMGVRIIEDLEAIAETEQQPKTTVIAVKKKTLNIVNETPVRLPYPEEPAETQTPNSSPDNQFSPMFAHCKTAEAVEQTHKDITSQEPVENDADYQAAKAAALVRVAK